MTATEPISAYAISAAQMGLTRIRDVMWCAERMTGRAFTEGRLAEVTKAEASIQIWDATDLRHDASLGIDLSAIAMAARFRIDELLAAWQK